MTFGGWLGKTPKCGKHARKKACGAKPYRPETNRISTGEECPDAAKHIEYGGFRDYGDNLRKIIDTLLKKYRHNNPRCY